ncbi:M23 family metallopeptidase [Anaerosacchariphilus polymeriproducens]|uniref:M23 family peptidase n=1 Tax=Anaerosacchariphilus polymeriproducens TaxID=1812858 RepID=A0A371AVN3_9FIRM|nr:M23 family metallopeptidase [Anaerosacchariphilus polymeriproducens]RDU23627.1 M23 family peptidase [Anaerosacchariphilus polymeriproducens]
MKKIVFYVLCVMEVICLACVYLAGGMAGAYAWSFAVFVLAPLSLIVALVQVIALLVRKLKKKSLKWNLMLLIISLIGAYPITILLGISSITYPTKADKKEEIAAVMPVKDGITFGGVNYKTHAIWPSECYAYDILVEPYDIESNDLTKFGIYNADVVAPVSGTIIGLENSEEDILPNTDEFKSQLGNYVFIKIDRTGTFMILAHLEKNSIKVTVGDHITEGEYIGKVGNSGTTSEPHLHIQHQRNNPLQMVFPTCSEGLPIKFKK